MDIKELRATEKRMQTNIAEFRKLLAPKRDELAAMETQLQLMKNELQRIQQDMIAELQSQLNKRQ